MNSQEDRSGSLLILNDLALILSTYGVLLLFNFIVEPISANTWIVCTFFVGIKILIVGIADITGIGRNYFVSLLFVLLADGIIILINQLMKFGLSLRLMVFMLVADLLAVFIAVFIWHRMGHDYYEEEEEEWYDETPVRTSNPRNPATREKPEASKQKPQIMTQTEGLAVESAGYGPIDETENIFDFHPLSEEPQNVSSDSGIGNLFSGINEGSVEGGEEFLRFDEITQELPSEDELSRAMRNSLETDTEGPSLADELDSSFDFFSGLNIFNQDERITQTDEGSETELDSFEEESVEPIEEAKTAPENEIEENIEPEVNLESESVVQKEAEISSEEAQTPESENVEEETETMPEAEAEEIEVTEPVEEEPVVTEEVEEETQVQEEPEEILTSETKEQEEVQSDRLADILEREEQQTQEEEEPLFIESVNDFSKITGIPFGFSQHFSPIPVSLDQRAIDNLRDQVREEMIRFNQNLGKIAYAYNDSLGDSLLDEKIDDFVELNGSETMDEAEQILRSNIRKIQDKEFISDNVMHSIGEMTAKLANRSYSINFAEDNLKERLERERVVEAERLRRQHEEEMERQRIEREKEEARKREEERQEQLRLEEEQRQRQLRLEEEQREQERLEAEKQASQTETSTKNEVHLQNDGLDIIIDAADLELLSEFLSQQAEN